MILNCNVCRNYYKRPLLIQVPLIFIGMFQYMFTPMGVYETVDSMCAMCRHKYKEKCKKNREQIIAEANKHQNAIDEYFATRKRRESEELIREVEKLVESELSRLGKKDLSCPDMAQAVAYAIADSMRNSDIIPYSSVGGLYKHIGKSDSNHQCC